MHVHYAPLRNQIVVNTGRKKIDVTMECISAVVAFARENDISDANGKGYVHIVEGCTDPQDAPADRVEESVA